MRRSAASSPASAPAQVFSYEPVFRRAQRLSVYFRPVFGKNHAETPIARRDWASGAPFRWPDLRLICLKLAGGQPYACAMQVSPTTTVAYLGPEGTFTEEALVGQPDLAAARRLPMGSFWEVLDAVDKGKADVGLVALENSIEGTVNVTLDLLIFAHDLWIVRELELEVAQCLVGLSGARLDQLKKVVSIPVATAQCRSWLSRNLSTVEEEASASTADAVRSVAEAQDPHVAAIGTRRAAALYGLEVLASSIEDHDANTTRFVLVARPEWGIPAATGHDKTSIVCFQSSDHPGSLSHHPRPVRGAEPQPDQARVAPNQERTGRILLCDRHRGPYRRRSSGGLLAGLARHPSSREVPGVVPCCRRGRRATAAGGKRSMVVGRQLAPGVATPFELNLVRWRRWSPCRLPAGLTMACVPLISGGAEVWRGGRAAECEALEKPWECKLPVGSNPTPSALVVSRDIPDRCLKTSWTLVASGKAGRPLLGRYGTQPRSSPSSVSTRPSRSATTAAHVQSADGPVYGRITITRVVPLPPVR